MAEKSQYAVLRSFLESDPNNPSLLVDVAYAASEEGDFQFAVDCFVTLDGLKPLSGALANAAGIAALRTNRGDLAKKWHIAAAGTDGVEDVALNFNVAYSLALSGDFDEALKYLGAEETGELPQAALLDLQIHHQLGKFQNAQIKMEAYLDKYPNYQPLHAAASVLAMDLDRPKLALEAALKAGDHPDALTTLGTLRLAENEVDDADAAFEKALATGDRNPRAQIGKGMVSLARGLYRDAAESMDAGASQFGDHLGSWIAAGWAYALHDDLATARDRFERAKSIDDTFGEAHGSLAVLDFLAGDMEAARRGAKVARRLDPSSFSGSLALILLAQLEGKPRQAREILQRALSTEVLPNGKTLQRAILQTVTGLPGKQLRD
ncbi:MAG: hypothetical protein AAFR64_07280 [Pseudomonadota bacterium]